MFTFENLQGYIQMKKAEWKRNNDKEKICFIHYWHKKKINKIHDTLNRKKSEGVYST